MMPAFLVGVLLSLSLRADETFTLTIADDNGIEHGLVVRVKPIQTFEEFNRASVWRITYDVSRFGRIMDLNNPFDIKLQFDIGGLCAKKPDQWSSVYDVRRVKESATHGEFDLEESVGCTIEIVKVAWISAEKEATVIAHNDAPAVDLSDQLKAIQSKRDRLAAERKKKQADDAASYAKYRADKEANEVAERVRVRAACTTIYKTTSDKKVGDLLVKEEQQVRACQALGLYPPR